MKKCCVGLCDEIAYYVAEGEAEGTHLFLWSCLSESHLGTIIKKVISFCGYDSTAKVSFLRG